MNFMKFSVPISSLLPRGLKNLIFSFYNKCELLSKATDGNFFVSKDFCYSIGDGVFKEQLLDKIILQQEKAQAKEQGNAQEATQAEQAEQGEHQGADENKLQLLGIKIENRTDDYEGDLVFSGFNQSEAQEETAREEQEEQEAVQETAAQEDTVQEKAVQEDAAQEDAAQVANKPNFDPAFDNIPNVGTETAANVVANNNAVEVAFTLETPLVTLRDRAISTFLDYLVNHCNDVKHVALEDEETRIEAAKNEKFAMRAWFTQLGWRGKEDNVLRSYFYDNLEGNTAFRTEEDHARWAAKWQPRYFDKHPEMKWVLEEQRESAEEQETTAPLSEQSEPESEVAPESDQNMAEEAEYVAASNLLNLIVSDETVSDEIVPDETAEETVAEDSEDSEDSEKSGKLEKSAIADLADSAEVAEAVSATVDTEESAEVDQEAAQEVSQEAATETVADLADSADVVPEAEIKEAKIEPEMNPEITDEKQHSVSN